MVFKGFGYVEGVHFRINFYTGFVYFDDPTIDDETKIKLSIALEEAIKQTERKLFQEDYFLQ